MTTGAAETFDDIVDIIERGDELAREHPYVAVALDATENVMIGGGYAAWRFAPLRHLAPVLPWSPVLVVFGGDGATRHDAFRAAFDAMARATRKAAPDALLCVTTLTTRFVGFGERLFVRWVLTSPSWSHPITLLLSPFATLAEAREGFTTCDINGGVVVAGGTDGRRRFRFEADPATRAALRSGACVVRKGAITGASDDTVAWCARLGYRMGEAAPDVPTVAEDPMLPSGAQLMPASGLCRYVPLTRVLGAVLANKSAWGAPFLFGVDFGDGRFRLVSAPDAGKPTRFEPSLNAVGVHHRSVFDTICLTYRPIADDVARVGAAPLQLPAAPAPVAK